MLVIKESDDDIIRLLWPILQWKKKLKMELLLKFINCSYSKNINENKNIHIEERERYTKILEEFMKNKWVVEFNGNIVEVDKHFRLVFIRSNDKFSFNEEILEMVEPIILDIEDEKNWK